VVDHALRTDRPEHIDLPHFPAKRKIRIVKALHLFNRLATSYERYTRLLRPTINEVAVRYQRPARLLELGSGSGEFALELTRLSEEKRLPVEVTGSDYLPEYVEHGNMRARQEGVNVRFRLVNAFDMQDLGPDAYDIILISQSMHHFTPGQLAMMLAQAQTVATTAFVGIDGYRGLLFFASVPALTWLLCWQPYIVHDTILSGCRAYSEYELELMARIAVLDSGITVKELFPGVSVLTARFDQMI
jgi:SAM-dependent methyltransferase